ncbi:MAG: DUF3237 domain-containing protein [Actinomycetes bacterium]
MDDHTPTTSTPTTSTTTNLLEPRLEFAFEARVAVDPPIRVGGPSPNEVLTFIAITGGTVAGPRVNGVILPGGGDWYTDRDGIVTLNARYLVSTHDGAFIDIANRGFWRADEGVTRRLDAGELVNESEYYYRTSPVFTTEADEYRWLTHTVFVGLAREEHGIICIRFFALD